jgi:hypothetical protein
VGPRGRVRGQRGAVPHRLAEDDEEERRVFHVAVTRCRETAAVIGDRTNLSPFVDELRFAADDGPRPAPRAVPAATDPTRSDDGQVVAAPGLDLVAPGGVPATITAVTREFGGRQVVELDVVGARARLGLDAPVTVDGRPVRLHVRAAPVRPPAPSTGRLLTTDDTLPAEASPRFEALREWRLRRASTDGVPPYIIFHDSHLRAMALAAPDSLAALARLPGVGPTKLDRYGDEILEVLDTA